MIITGPFRSTGTYSGYTPLISEATLYDPNSIIGDVIQDKSGITVTMANAGASRALPDVAAVWSIPGIVAIDGERLTQMLPQNHRIAVRVHEKQVPATQPHLIRYGLGYADHADPNQATFGIIWAHEMPATNLRKTLILRCNAGTWAETNSTTGQATCFGVDGSVLPNSPTALDEINCLPLDSLGNLSTIGSNSARYSTIFANAPNFTHTYVFVGWQATGGNNGDVIKFNCKSWVIPLR